MDIKSLLSPQDAPPNPPPPKPPPPAQNTQYNAKDVRPSSQTNAHRHSSSSMDTLADLASMQLYQASMRSQSVARRNPDAQSPINSPTASSNPPYNNGSYPPTPTRARSCSYITRHHEQHTKSTPIATPLSDDLPIMEQPVLVGEQPWVEKLQDSMFAAKNVQDRIAVMELCAQSVSEEPYSPRLWQMYGDWMWVLYRRSNHTQGVYQQCALEQVEMDGKTLDEQEWSDEDVNIGKEVFQWEPMMDIWKQGVQATQWHMDLSHTVWSPYLQLTMEDISQSPTRDKIREGFQLFHERLCQPHQAWDDTYNSFSSFVDQHDQPNYAEAMKQAKRNGQKYQAAYEMRQRRELDLRLASQGSDVEHEKDVWRDYLDWEEQQHRQKATRQWTRNLYIALCQRATLRFPKEADFWLDFVVFFMEPDEDKNALLETAERATRHCPGSGELWAQRLFAMEACNRPYKEIETVKHNATSTGQLEDNNNMAELIKVECAWCNYLRRTAFSAQAAPDSVDVAEMAIRSAIENVARVGRDKYGDAFRGDPEFRVERIYLKFLAQAAQYNDGREMFHRLESTHGDSHFFWERWYLWEMTVWESAQDRSVDAKSHSVPTQATAALKRAMRRQNLDWPEKIVEMFLHHCAHHENAQALIEAQVESRRAMKRIKKIRDQQAAYAAQQEETYREQLDVQQQQTTGKRSRDDEDAGQAESKRPRRDSNNTAEESSLTDLPSTATAQVKRDRENTTVLVSHLPGDVDELSLKKYFRDCGEILSIAISKDEEHNEATATLEFRSAEDTLTAQTKTLKPFGNKAIDVRVAPGSLLWVTNYPAKADEPYLRDLFGRYGEVVEVRFPSLRGNTHRRFCYVQFATTKQAAEASTALNGKHLEHNHQLTALLSDPGKKKQREGATEEGRELCVRNVDWSANEADVRQLLESHGLEDIENVRIPRNASGKSKATAFVVFKSKDEAERAVQSIDKSTFKNRVLDVHVARSNAKKSQSTTVVRGRQGSTGSQASSSHQAANTGSPPSDVPMGGMDPSTTPNGIAAEQVRASDRTLALLDVPDTVNDTRIQKLCEPYGNLVKIVLKPKTGGALVEFEEAKAMANAAMHLAGLEVIPGHRLRIGEAREVIHGTTKRQGNDAKAKGRPLTSRPIERPAQAGERRGGRGKVGSVFNRAAYEKKNQESEKSSEEKVSGGPKSQDDFRAMLTGGPGGG